MKTVDAMDDYINELIDIKKPIIACVDGSAIGIGMNIFNYFNIL